MNFLTINIVINDRSEIKYLYIYIKNLNLKKVLAFFDGG